MSGLPHLCHEARKWRAQRGGRGSPPRLESRLERASMARPQPMDRILILKEQWLQQILLGGKTMEIRCRPLAAGRYWLGCSVTASLLGHIGGSGVPPGTRRRARSCALESVC